MRQVTLPAPSGLRPGDSVVKKWVVAARVPFLTASVLPTAAATAAAWWVQGRVWAGGAALCIAGMALLQAGSNLANDYFDHLSGTDAANRQATPFSGGSRVIQEGVVSARAVLAAAVVCLAAGAACGAALWVSTRSTALLAIGASGLALGWFYTGAPLRLAHHGLGELAVFAAFGPLPALGVDLVQRGTMSVQVAWVGVPAGLLVAAILVANEFPDCEADAAAGKRHLVVRLGRARGAVLYGLTVVAAYLALGVGVAMGWMPPLACVAALAAPLTWKAIRVVRLHHDDVRAMLPAQAATIGQQAVFLLLLTGAYVADLALRGS